jgi:hypothetical protein
VEGARFVHELEGPCVEELVVGEEVLVVGPVFTGATCHDLLVRSVWERQGQDFDALAHELGFTTRPLGLQK